MFFFRTNRPVNESNAYQVQVIESYAEIRSPDLPATAQKHPQDPDDDLYDNVRDFNAPPSYGYLATTYQNEHIPVTDPDCPNGLYENVNPVHSTDSGTGVVENFKLNDCLAYGCISATVPDQAISPVDSEYVDVGIYVN